MRLGDDSGEMRHHGIVWWEGEGVVVWGGEGSTRTHCHHGAQAGTTAIMAYVRAACLLAAGRQAGRRSSLSTKRRELGDVEVEVVLLVVLVLVGSTLAMVASTVATLTMVASAVTTLAMVATTAAAAATTTASAGRVARSTLVRGLVAHLEDLVDRHLVGLLGLLGLLLAALVLGREERFVSALALEELAVVELALDLAGRGGSSNSGSLLGAESLKLLEAQRLR